MMMTMKSCLSGPFLLLLLSSTVSGLGSVVWKEYKLYRSHVTWREAQSFCRRFNDFTDLATFYKQSDADSTNLEVYLAWIGFYKDMNPSSSTYNEWIWSDRTGKKSDLIEWANNEPAEGDECALTLYNNERIFATGCGGISFFFCQKTSNTNTEYKFIPQPKTWFEARDYCTREYGDLASFTDRGQLRSALQSQDFPVWTGLYRDGKAWKWSSGSSEYRNWKSDEPGNKGNCVSISSKSKQMSTQNCDTKIPFVCLEDNLVLVKENKTWEEALEHCRSLMSNNKTYDLVSVQPGKDDNYVINKVKTAVTERVWAGLRFLAGHWLWVNGADMSYSDLPRCHLEMQQCGAFSRNEKSGLEIRDCAEKRNFLCYRNK